MDDKDTDSVEGTGNDEYDAVNSKPENPGQGEMNWSLFK